MRDASWLELPARYSTSIPANFLKASGSFVLAPGSGGPLTTTLPSLLAAANNASQPEVAAGAVVGAGPEGGAAGPHPTATAPARPTLASARLRNSCRRVTNTPANVRPAPVVVSIAFSLPMTIALGRRRPPTPA